MGGKAHRRAGLVLALLILTAVFCAACGASRETGTASAAGSGAAQPVLTETAPAEDAPQADTAEADVPEDVPEDTPEDDAPSVPAPETPASPEEETTAPTQAAETDDTAYTCTVSISCATVLDNLDLCDPDKVELIPEDGWVLRPVTVSFAEGDTAFDVLARVCREEKIHMEYTDTPLYHSTYIEGIQNLYEFDAGPLSGWMYSVNGQFPNYGSSRCQLSDGDVVCWLYTCDLGADIGGGSAAGQQAGS
jgi:hypothetical protein